MPLDFFRARTETLVQTYTARHTPQSNPLQTEYTIDFNPHLQLDN